MVSSAERLNESARMVGEQSPKPLQFTSLEDYWNSSRASSLIEELHAIYPFKAPQKRDEKIKKLQLFVKASFQRIAESVLTGEERTSNTSVFYTAKNTTKLFVKSGEGVEVSLGMFGLRQLVRDRKVVPIPDALVVDRKGNFAEISIVYAYATSKADEAKVQEQYQHYLDNLADGKYTSETKFVIVAPSDIQIGGIADAEHVSLPFSSQDFETSWIDHLTPVGFGKDLAHFGYTIEKSTVTQPIEEQNDTPQILETHTDALPASLSPLMPITDDIATDYVPSDVAQSVEEDSEDDEEEEEAYAHSVRMRRAGQSKMSRRRRADWQ